MGDLPAMAISVRQPWAWALIHGGKDVENRNKAPIGTANLIGDRITVHAAKGMTQHEYESAAEYMAKLGVRCPRPDALIRGAVIGHMRLDAVVSERPSRWFFGPRGLVVSDPISVTPVPSVGQLGWFRWRADGADVEPLPWMLAWPEKASRVRRPAPEPSLFGDTP